jgi:transposase
MVLLHQLSQSDKVGRLTGEQIKHYITVQFAVNYHLNRIYKLLAKLGFSWITSRSRHPKQSQPAQVEFTRTAN